MGFCYEAEKTGPEPGEGMAIRPLLREPRSPAAGPRREVYPGSLHSALWIRRRRTRRKGGLEAEMKAASFVPGVKTGGDLNQNEDDPFWDFNYPRSPSSPPWTSMFREFLCHQGGKAKVF